MPSPRSSSSIADSRSNTIAEPPTSHAKDLEGRADVDAIKTETLDENYDPWLTDPDNPRAWSGSKKWTMAAIVSGYTFVSPLASSMMAPGLPGIAIGYGIHDTTILSLTLSIFLLAYALGPLALGPLSELYGRTWVLHIANVVFAVFNLGCALAPNTGALIAFRFFAGLAGSAPLAIGAGSIADMFDESNRAAAMAIFSLGPLIGPVVGPVAGGFVADTIGYKWVFWIITIAAGSLSLVAIPLLRETYAPVIRRRKARAANKAAGLPLVDPNAPTLTSVLWVNLTRPMVLLTRSLICFMLSLYMALIYGFLYLLFVTFPTLYSEVYGWGPGVAGLAYLGPGIGFLIATGFSGKVMDKWSIQLSNKYNNGVRKAEYRLPIMIIGSFFIPIGLLWYGWSADQGIHWIMTLIGSCIFGAGMMLCFMPIQVYLIDVFTYAASAIAAATLIRSLFGFAFPLFASKMFDVMGTGGGCSFLAGVSIVVGIPFPIYLFYKGEELRARNPLTR